MAHEISNTDNFGEVRENGERAWHGLGMEIPAGLSPTEGFKRIGLNWGTVLIPVEVEYPPGSGIKIKDDDFQMHVREDTQTSLGIVGKDYRAVSNKALADFAESLAGPDKAVRLETAGSLRGGKRVFCTLRLPKDIEVVDGDMLNMFIIGSNAHDGSGAFQWYGSSVRVVCANTLAWSEHGARNMIKFQHSGDVEIKLEVARAALGIVVKEANKYEKEIRELVKLGMKKAQIQAYFEAVYDQTFGKISADWPEKQQQQRAEHKKKTVASWLEKMDEPHQTIKGIKGTAWAAYNAFSEWCDHDRSNYAPVTEKGAGADARVHSNLFGISARDKRRAWGQALTLAK